MVMPTPFERLLSEVAQQATKEPLAAFARLQECYNSSLTDADVHKLCSVAGNLGGALGRWDDVITFLSTLLVHPALQQGGPTERSIWRATAVMQRCAGRTADAENSLAKGASGPADRARVELMTANTLVARGRLAESALPLSACARHLAEVSADDELRPHAAQVAAQLGRAAEVMLHQARAALLAASAVTSAATASGVDWRSRHRALYQEAHARILAGDPRRALDAVQQMMELEDAEDAGPAERFFTASLACRAQRLRGQQRVAQGALEACRDFAARIEGPLAQQAQQLLSELARDEG